MVLAIRFRQMFALALALFVISLPGVAAGSQTMGPPDPDAPPGAKPNWLPDLQWVMERWVPFNEDRLYSVLGLTEAQVAQYLYTYPARSLDHLAAIRGVNVRTFATQVQGKRGPEVSRTRWRSLKWRTGLVLAQSHLSQHMLFHPFHIRQIADQLWVIAGVPHAAFVKRFEYDGQSLGQIAISAGRTKASVRGLVLRMARANGQRGVMLGAMSPEENHILQVQDVRDFAEFWHMTYTSM